MKEWKVKYSGRLERIFIFYFGLSLLFGALILSGSPTKREGLRDMSDSGNFWAFLIILTPFWLPVVLVTLSRLFKSKIAKAIVVHHENHEVEIHLNKKKILKVRFDQLSFAVSGNNFHRGVTFYRTYIGTRGQLVTQKITEVIGVKYTLSWKMSQLVEIVNELRANQINETKAENRNLPLWERIISN